MLAAISVVSVMKTFSQDGDYDKILALLVDEQYEKVLYKCEPYTLKDDTKNDPIPYLYMAMAYLEISKRGEFAEKYPKSFKESLKYATKHRKKDKENKYYKEFGDFFSELRQLTISEAETLNDQAKYTSSKSYYQNLVSIDEQDPGAVIMLGYVFAKLKSKKEATDNFSKAKKMLEENGTDGLAEEQVRLLKNAIMKLATMFMDEGNSSEARAWIELGNQYFEEDKEYQTVYRDIAG